MLTEQLAAPTPESLLDEVVKQKSPSWSSARNLPQRKVKKAEIYWKAAQKQIPGYSKGVEGKPRWEDK